MASFGFQYQQMSPSYVVLLAVAAMSGPAANEPVAVVPIRLEKNLPIADVRINGAIVPMILDSAAAGFVLHGPRAAELGLAQSGSGLSSGSGGAQSVGLAGGVKADLGGAAITADRVILFDMTALKFAGPVDGILGMPLFGRYVVEIDYPGLKARIYDPKSFRAGPNAEVIPMRMTVGPTVKGSVKLKEHGVVPLDIQLDTGSAHVLTLATPFVDRYGLATQEGVTTGHTLGFGGSAPDVVGTVEEVRIGRRTMRNASVRFSRHTSGSFASERFYSGNMGGEFLKPYRVTFDVPGSRLILE